LREKEVKEKVNLFVITLILTGIFGGGFLIAHMVMKTFIRLDTIFNIWILCGALCFLVHFFFLKKMYTHIGELVFYSLGGWASILTALFLWLNSVSWHDANTRIYDLRGKNAEEFVRGNWQEAGIQDPLYKDYAYLRSFDDSEIEEGPVSGARITTASGCFGYKIILSKELF
jgi:hypothetical protein